jgi:hypothetical protein
VGSSVSILLPGGGVADSPTLLRRLLRGPGVAAGPAEGCHGARRLLEMEPRSSGGVQCHTLLWLQYVGTRGTSGWAEGSRGHRAGRTDLQPRGSGSVRLCRVSSLASVSVWGRHRVSPLVVMYKRHYA